MYCDCGNKSENVMLGGKCASCKRLDRKVNTLALKPAKEKKPISKVSGKMAKELEIYVQKKTAWLKGKRCAVYPQLPAIEVHHMKGRVGYADQWAEDNRTPLLIDLRFWLPVSRPGHNAIENNPLWATEMGFSLSRLEKRE